MALCFLFARVHQDVLISEVRHRLSAYCNALLIAHPYHFSTSRRILGYHHKRVSTHNAIDLPLTLGVLAAHAHRRRALARISEIHYISHSQ